MSEDETWTEVFPQGLPPAGSTVVFTKGDLTHKDWCEDPNCRWDHKP